VGAAGMVSSRVLRIMKRQLLLAELNNIVLSTTHTYAVKMDNALHHSSYKS